MYSTYVLAGVGFFLAGLNGTASGALHVVTLVNVGLVGVVSFLRHVVFARSDAARMGWGDEAASNFQLEVGFANLAVGLTALVAWAGGWGAAAEVAVTLVFGLYLLQAALLHLRNRIRDHALGPAEVAKLLGIASMAVGLLVVAVIAAVATPLKPF
jgi:hypothetical protein